MDKQQGTSLLIRACAISCLLSVSTGCAADDDAGGGLCVPDERRCVDLEVQVCSADGSEWTFYRECADSCTDGACGLKGDEGACTANARRCVGNDVQICGADGSGWSFLETCTDTCVGGECGTGDSGATGIASGWFDCYLHSTDENGCEYNTGSLSGSFGSWVLQGSYACCYFVSDIDFGEFVFVYVASDGSEGIAFQLPVAEILQSPVIALDSGGQDYSFAWLWDGDVNDGMYAASTGGQLPLNPAGTRVGQRIAGVFSGIPFAESHWAD